MLKRTLTGLFIIAVMVGAFLLRQFVDYRLFNILIYVFAIAGTFEMLRAFGDKLTFFNRSVVCAYALTVIPAMTFLSPDVWRMITFAATLLTLSSFVLEFRSASVESVSYSLLLLFYPTGLLTAMTALNVSGETGFIALLLVFVIASFSDTGAYFIGSLVKGRKLCPEISPKKTVSGFIGGLIGGSIGAVLVRIVFDGAKGMFFEGDLEWLIYLFVGLFGAAVSAFGDLVEGGMKRKLGLKDMGDVLPGHGGILDRIDSTMFTSVFIYFVLRLVAQI